MVPYFYKLFILYILFIGSIHHEIHGNEPIAVDQNTNIQKAFHARKRKSTETKKKNTSLKQMNDYELVALQKEAMSKKNFSLVIKCLERRMRLATNPETVANLIFELGEIQFEFGKLDLSIITLNDFKRQFPGHKEVEEAHYKICVAAFLNTLGSEHDQTNTDIAISFANEYLTHPDHFDKYRSEVQTFKQQAIKRKADHELTICSFHQKRGHTTAVKRRIEYIEKELVPDLPELESQILALKKELSRIEEKKTNIASTHKQKKYKDRF